MGRAVIVSKTHKFIFVHIPKNAGTSVRNSLMPFADGNALANQKTKHEDLPTFFARHGASFPDYFKFAFVRNPWDRIVSFYFFLRQHMSDEISEIQAVDDFKTFLRLLDRDVAWLKSRHSARQQMAFIVDDDNKLLVDFVGRYENLSADYVSACRRVGIKSAIGHDNKSDHLRYAAYYDDWGRDFVARRYRDDIDCFGYKFGA